MTFAELLTRMTELRDQWAAGTNGTTDQAEIDRFSELFIAGAAVLWYMVQALDELVAGNLFHSGLWEYPILLVWFGSILYILRHERTSA